MSLRSTSVCFLLKIVYVAVILSLQGHTKEIRSILESTGDFYLKLDGVI